MLDENLLEIVEGREGLVKSDRSETVVGEEDSDKDLERE